MIDETPLPTHAKMPDGKLNRFIEFDKNDQTMVWVSNGLVMFSVRADELIFYFAENMGILDRATGQYRCERCGCYLNHRVDGDYECKTHGRISMVDKETTRVRSYDTG